MTRRLSLLKNNPKLLVTAQFGLGLAILGFGSRPHGWLLQSLLLVALSLGVWAIAVKSYRVNVFPVPTSKMKLITHGPYRLIRHPMYTVVLLSTFSFLFTRTHQLLLVPAILWLLLAGVMIMKMNFEEKLLLSQYQGYRKYIERTQRLIPFVY